MARVRTYSSLLPGYLAGNNIGKHVNIIEWQDKLLNDEMCEILSWCKLERPILIEKQQSSLGSSTITVHISTDTVLKSVFISGDYTYSHEYEEDELLETDSITFTFSPGGLLANPQITVMVETYDDMTYFKSYPENDVAIGSSADHDEWLDRLGTFLGIPRLQYKPYNINDGANANPSFFGKETTPITTISGTVEYRVESTTEDDYYYSQRLQSFIESFNTRELVLTLIQIRYGYNRVAMSNIQNLSTNIARTVLNAVFNSSFTNAQVESMKQTVGGGVYAIFVDSDDTPVNMYPLTTTENKVEFINTYLPITRMGMIVEYATPDVTSILKNIIPGEVLLEVVCTYPDLPVEVTVDSNESYTTSFDARGRLSIEDLSTGSHTVSIVTTDPGAILDYSTTFLIPTYNSTFDDIYYMNVGENFVMVGDVTSDDDTDTGYDLEVSYTIEGVEE